MLYKANKTEGKQEQQHRGGREGLSRPLSMSEVLAGSLSRRPVIILGTKPPGCTEEAENTLGDQSHAFY